MQKDYKLPFESQPLVTCYHNFAFSLGIIEANASLCNKDINPWIISKFLNCVFDESQPIHLYDIGLFDRWATNDKIIYHQYINMFKSMYHNLNIDIIDYLSKIIYEGCYITGLYNEKYIPGKQAYQKSDYLHDYILYGVNHQKKVFYSAGYLSNHKYTLFEISFDDYLKSIYNTSIDRLQFSFWSYNEKSDYNIDTNRILAEFKDYLNSTTSHGTKQNVWYGLEANTKLKEYFLQSAEEHEPPMIDLRYSRAFMEHKFFISLCIKYLYTNKIIDGVYIDSGEIESIYNSAILVHSLGIKMNISHDYSIIKRIVNIMDNIQAVEQKVINNIINNLK